MNPWHPEVASRANEKCEYCKAPQRFFNMLFEVEHVFPIALGGTNDIQNLALACRRCNLHKGIKLPVMSVNDALNGEIFHPRIQVWEENFELNSLTGEILGRTPIGVRTITILQMNAPPAVQARLLWIKFGIFP